MLVFVAAALAASSLPPRPASLTAQATATIRVIRGVEIRFGARSNPDAPPARASIVRAVDGSRQPAELVEFR